MTFTDEIVACYVPWYTPMENLCWYIPIKLQWKKKEWKKNDMSSLQKILLIK